MLYRKHTFIQNYIEYFKESSYLENIDLKENSFTFK